MGVSSPKGRSPSSASACMGGGAPSCGWTDRQRRSPPRSAPCRAYSQSSRRRTASCSKARITPRSRAPRATWSGGTAGPSSSFAPRRSVLTMRLFAEERKLGTLELLWTYPVRDAEIVAGKFVACLAVVVVLLAATAVHPAMVARLYVVRPGPLLAGYAGLALLGAAFVGCGLFVSALTESQLVAAAATYGILFFFWMVTWNEAAVSETALRLLVPFSLFDRFYPFARGAIDTRDVAYLVLFTVTCLAFTLFALDTRRWRGLR